MKRVGLFLTVVAAMILSACGNGGGSQPVPELPEMIEVEILLPEENPEPGTTLVLETYVSQGGEAVEDANEVEFEVLKHGEEESRKALATHQGEGIYTAEMDFPEEGIYAVTAHVTARDMHNMPTEDLVIGNPSEMPAEDSSGVEDEGTEEDEHQHE